MKYFVLTLGLALAACQTQGADSGAFTATAYACASATASLKTAILFNAKLTPATRARVTQAVAVVDPICSQENPPTLTSSGLAALQGALASLTSAAAEAQK